MRRLTISAQYQPRRHQLARVPHLRLTGRWLEQAGFTAGARVIVHVLNGQLVITVQP
jgi:hypothetical protein